MKLNYADPAAVEQALNVLNNPDLFSSLSDNSATQVEAGDDPAKPACKVDSQACQQTDLTQQALTVLADRKVKDGLKALLVARGLEMDMRAPKTILVGTDAAGKVEHVDFVGLMRGNAEVLAAPDAVSAFVIRFQPGGELSLIERRPDADVDIKSLKFSFER